MQNSLDPDQVYYVYEIDLGSNFAKVISRMNLCRVVQTKGTHFELCIDFFSPYILKELFSSVL